MKDLESFEKVYFQIADHIVEFSAPKSIKIELLLPTFTDFLVKPSSDSKPLIKIKLTLENFPTIDNNVKLLSNTSTTWGDKFCFEESSEEYITSVKGKIHDKPWKMHSSKDFSKSTIFAVEEELYSSSVIPWLMMVAYAQGMLKYKTILIHASVIEKDGLGYAFLGKSGTGKSTHSRLWLENIQGSRLLNDDNPIIRIDKKNNILIFGSPWSGKTPCYINEGVELKALIRLEQFSENNWKYLSGKSAFIGVLPSCTAIRWDVDLYNKMLDSVEEIIKNTIIGHLSCLPNKESAILCYQKVNEKI